MDFQKMFKKYRDDHQHPMNKFFHFIGIPTIITSIFILFVNWKLGLS
ncbi:Mpo1-like protein, partial [Bacillus toyonensis]